MPLFIFGVSDALKILYVDLLSIVLLKRVFVLSTICFALMLSSKRLYLTAQFEMKKRWGLIKLFSSYNFLKCKHDNKF